ncbi:putative phage tail protein [Paenibacillus wulumuqiensis]|uniref:putative phage tail protein n=1 Tax=Paenibacillus wulumuqiensis TaxID=1567107 RepID=UPI00061977BA|nr:putative phage tail protein [Paenibacillus wulumuqiensis]
MKTLGEQKQAMKDYLPTYYRESVIVNNIMDRDAAEINKWIMTAYEVLDQMFIGTATWGLARWEHIFGIKAVTGQTYEQRREILRSKLRSSGSVTAALVKSVAESYSNGQVSVTIDAAKYTVNITFVSAVGIPGQLDILKSVIRGVIPAHLAIAFNFRYLLIKEVHEVMTLDQIQSHKLSDFAGGAV